MNKYLIRIVVSLLAISFYFLGNSYWSDVRPLKFWAPHNVRILIPILIGVALFFKYYKPPRKRKHYEEEDNDKTVKPANSEHHASVAVKPAAAETATATVEDETADGADNPDWIAARKMPHSIIPDPEIDKDYLQLMHKAANSGCVVAMAKIGEYAWRRSAFVEAFFWYSLAADKKKGAFTRELTTLLSTWLSNGCNGEYENNYPEFDENRGSYSRALLRKRAGIIDRVTARQRLEELRPLIAIEF